MYMNEAIQRLNEIKMKGNNSDMFLRAKNTYNANTKLFNKINIKDGDNDKRKKKLLVELNRVLDEVQKLSSELKAIG